MLAGVPVRVKREPVPRYNSFLFFFFVTGVGGEEDSGHSWCRALVLILSHPFSHALLAPFSRTRSISLFRSLSFFGKIKREPKNRNETKDSCICKSMYTCIMNVLVPPGSLDTLSRSHSFSRSHSLTLTLRRLSLSLALFCFLITKHEKGRLVASRALTSIDFPRRANDFVDVRRTSNRYSGRKGERRARTSTKFRVVTSIDG